VVDIEGIKIQRRRPPTLSREQQLAYTPGYRMWVLLSLLSGLSDASRDALSKSGSKAVPHVMLSWSYSLLALPYFLPILLLNQPSEIPLNLVLLALGVGMIHVLGSLGLVYALSRSDLSLCVPMIAFTPVFLLVVGPLMTGHSPSAYAIAGTFLVAGGCYLLNIADLKEGLLGPVKALGRDKGVRMMLVLSLVWAVSAAIDLRAVREYGLSFWATVELLAIAILFLPIVIAKKGIQGMTPAGWRYLACVGLGNALSFGPYLLALSSTHALYVVCLKRCNIFFALIIGKMFFGEDSLRGRLLGAIIMFVGVSLITILG